jgi:hypothetical protein
MLSVSGCTFCDRKTNKEIKDKLNIYNLSEAIVDCSRRWKQQLLKMNAMSAPKCL